MLHQHSDRLQFRPLPQDAFEYILIAKIKIRPEFEQQLNSIGVTVDGSVQHGMDLASDQSIDIRTVQHGSLQDFMHLCTLPGDKLFAGQYRYDLHIADNRRLDVYAIEDEPLSPDKVITSQCLLQRRWLRDRAQ